MQRRIRKLISVLLLLILWYLAAALINAPLILPFPHSVLLRLCALMKTSFFWKSFFFTFLRVISAFLIFPADDYNLPTGIHAMAAKMAFLNGKSNFITSLLIIFN